MDEIAELLPMVLEEGVSVRFKGWATMLDGKALGYINRVLAMQNCPLCNATPTKMSTRDSLFDTLIDDPDALKHGFSPLHYKMRAMEFLLHLGMHSRIKLAACPTSKVEGEKTPEQIDRDERLKQIQDALEVHLRIKVCRRDKMGGSTNSGPVAKPFFTGNPEVMAKILDVPAELFITLRDMGNAISSSFEINPDEFQKIADRFHTCFFDNFQKPQTPEARDESEDRRGAPSRGRSGSAAGSSRGRAGRAPQPTPQEQEEDVENHAPEADPQEQEDVDDPEPEFRRVRQHARSTGPRGRSTRPRGQSTRGTDLATRRPARSTTAPPNYRDESSEDSDGTNTERLLRGMHINVGRGRGNKRSGAKRTSKKKKAAKAETWYMISSTVHKVYKHGAAIIKACNFPPGLLSEEPSEANNKKIRYFREKLTRKFTRKQTMTDLFHRLLYCSDPLILQDIAPKRLRKRRKQPIHPSIVPLLKTPDVDGQKFEESAVSRFCLYLHEKEVFESMDYEDDHRIVGDGNYTYQDDDAEENPGNIFWTRAEPETPAPQDQGDIAQPTASLSQRVNESESDPMDDDNWDGSPIENIVFHPPKPANNTMSLKTAATATTSKPSSGTTDSSDTNQGKRKKRQQRPRKFSKCEESSSSE